jgi:hypothetical protein
MPKVLSLICLMPAFLAGCTQSGAAASASLQPPAADVSANARDDRAAAMDRCVLTQSIQSRAPESTEGGPPGPEVHAWFVNADRTIWMLDQARVAGKRTKTAWFRPARTKLEVTGRRLDADAAPLFVETSPTGEEYRHKFQPSIMIFPTPGCWEITAKAGTSEARFVVNVTKADGLTTTSAPRFRAAINDAPDRGNRRGRR